MRIATEFRVRFAVACRPQAGADGEEAADRGKKAKKRERKRSIYGRTKPAHS